MALIIRCFSCLRIKRYGVWVDPDCLLKGFINKVLDKKISNTHVDDILCKSCLEKISFRGRI